MSKGKWCWLGCSALIMLVAGEYLSGWLTLVFLKLSPSQLHWNTYLEYVRALDIPQVQTYAGRIKTAGAIGFGLPARSGW